jgi:hypothetical protein
MKTLLAVLATSMMLTSLAHATTDSYKVCDNSEHQDMTLTIDIEAKKISIMENDKAILTDEAILQNQDMPIAQVQPAVDEIVGGGAKATSAKVVDYKMERMLLIHTDKNIDMLYSKFSGMTTKGPDCAAIIKQMADAQAEAQAKAEVRDADKK